MAYADEVLADSPLFYLKLDEASGTSVADASGNARHFTNSGAAVNQPSVLPSGTASYDFGNLIAHRLTKAYESWMNAAAFTVEAWIRGDSFSSYRAVMSRDSAGVRGWTLYVTDGKLNLFSGSSSEAQSAATLSTGTVYHVAATYDGTNVRLYINGALDSTHARAVNTTFTYEFVVGASHAGSGSDFFFPFDGRLDEIAFYGSALSGARLAAHYAAASGGPAPVSGSLVAVLPW